MIAAPSSEPVRILHLSDTHFVGNLKSKGGRWGVSWAAGAAAHDFAKIEALITILTRLGDGVFDHLLITGDVSTDGSLKSLELARKFVEEDQILDSIMNRLVSYGLACPPEKRTVLPGNHDRYGRFLPLQRRSTRFEKVFFEGASYPYVRLIEPPRPGSPYVLLFVFDSTQVLRLRERLTMDMLLKRMARGEVSPAECNWLGRESRRISELEKVGNLSLDLKNCVRLVALHHHPVESPKRGRFAQFKGMDNNAQFVRACLDAGINVVLFGHQHQAYRVTVPGSGHGMTPFGPRGPVHFLCCPSTLEYSVRKPGFYLHEVYLDRIAVHHYYWEGGGFSEHPDTFVRRFV
jgi:3',5'-cyclic AMP phosphodiesterase CpdA